MATRQRSDLAANLLLAGGSLGFALLLLLALEGGLRWADIGDGEAAPSSLKYQRIDLPLLRPGVRADGTRVLWPRDGRLPYQFVLEEKPERGLRILVFGGSAAAGLGYSPNVTFARYLERMLRAAQPGRSIEVLNLGIVALASKQVKALAADSCRLYEPDLIVVYSGNNEFLELHAEKYARVHSGPLERIGSGLRDTHLFRALASISRRARPMGAPDAGAPSTDDLRLTQREIVTDIAVSEAETAVLVDRYAQNLHEIVVSASSHGARALLLTVASNWKWRGRSDLEGDWATSLVAGRLREGEPLLEGVRRIATTRLEAADPARRWELLFRRAVAAEALGDMVAAKADFRAAMNADPHLRRALDAMNERVAEVAAEGDQPLLDTVALLSRQAPHGIIGFEDFYDYVHFTPRGALLVAAGLFERIRTLGLLEATDYDPEALVRSELARLAGAERDFLEVDSWVGFGFQRSRITDRDLWKYEGLRRDLDEAIHRDPENVDALIYRGNHSYFELEGAARAAEDYRRAVRIHPGHPQATVNLARILDENPR